MENLVKRTLSFYKGKNVFLTGHTGFKGSWLARLLISAGANVTGYALNPESDPNLYSICGIKNRMHSVIGDVRDFEHLNSAVQKAQPDIIFHLAAQPIVRDSYKNPRYTYEVNVMGTVNLLESVRLLGGKRSVLNVTTDKVYLNREWCWGYREDEMLDGYDPYSNSKSCSELATHSYIRSFFEKSDISVSTARAGNVLGGGDFASDRIVPDCARAAAKEQAIVVRNPCSIRPYQHVLEPLFAYMMIAAQQYEAPGKAGFYNVGPDDQDCISTGTLVDLFCHFWPGARWTNIQEANAPHEANFLKLDCSLIKRTFGWHPTWNAEKAIEKTVEWYRAHLNGEDLPALMDRQIHEFFEY